MSVSIAERNRANAQHSTGPRTPQGKAVSSQNARKHGYAVSGHYILSNEDPQAFETFQNDLLAIFQPKSDRELLAVMDIAECRWALRRLDEAEMIQLNRHLSPSNFGDLEDLSPAKALAVCCILEYKQPQPLEVPSLELLHRYRRPWERRHQEALREFDRASLARQREERLAMAREREAIKLALLKQKLVKEQAGAAKAGQATEQEALLASKSNTTKAPATGFVPSTAHPTPPEQQQSAAA